MMHPYILSGTEDARIRVSLLNSMTIPQAILLRFAFLTPRTDPGAISTFRCHLQAE